MELASASRSSRRVMQEMIKRADEVVEVQMKKPLSLKLQRKTKTNGRPR